MEEDAKFVNYVHPVYMYVPLKVYLEVFATKLKYLNISALKILVIFATYVVLVTFQMNLVIKGDLFLGEH